MIGLHPFDQIPTELFDLQEKILQLHNLPEIDGAWANPASLSRFGYTSMPHKMLRRFEKKIKPYDMGHKIGAHLSSPCWLWQGGLHPKGYGRFWLGETDEGDKIWAYAHRIAFEHWIGFPKPGYIVDHECNIKTCCNPLHLWPQSNAENLRLADLRRPYKRRNQYSKE